MVVEVGAEIVLQGDVQDINQEGSMKAKLTMHEKSFPQNSQGCGIYTKWLKKCSRLICY